MTMQKLNLVVNLIGGVNGNCDVGIEFGCDFDGDGDASDVGVEYDCDFDGDGDASEC